MNELSFQKILQRGYCIFILTSSWLHCHPCSILYLVMACTNVEMSSICLPWRSQICHLLYLILQKKPLLPFALIYPFNLLFLSLQILWIMCFLISGSAWKTDQCLYWYLASGALYHRLWLVYQKDYLHFVCILWCFFVFLRNCVCSEVSKMGISKHWYLSSPEVHLSHHWKLSSMRHTCPSCRTRG